MNPFSPLSRMLCTGIGVAGLIVACGNSGAKGFPASSGAPPVTTSTVDATVVESAAPPVTTGTDSSTTGNSTDEASACPSTCSQDSDCLNCPLGDGGGIVCCDTNSSMCFPTSATVCSGSNGGDGGNGPS
jgi:hypothetical protein